jgi:hypothetical protein
MLAQIKEATPAAVAGLLREMTVRARYHGEEVGTIDSTVWDVTARRLHVYYKRDFDHPLIFNLDEELAKGARTVALDTLFPDPVPFEPGWRGENGPIAASREK